MPVPVIDCRTLSVSLTLNNFSHQMKSNYITTTHVGWFPACLCVQQDECVYWSVISFSLFRCYIQTVDTYWKTTGNLYL